MWIYNLIKNLLRLIAIGEKKERRFEYVRRIEDKDIIPHDYILKKDIVLPNSTPNAPRKIILVDDWVWEQLGKVSLKANGYSPSLILAALATSWAKMTQEEQRIFLHAHLNQGIENTPVEIIDLRSKESKKQEYKKQEDKPKTKTREKEKRVMEDGWRLWIEQLAER